MKKQILLPCLLLLTMGLHAQTTCHAKFIYYVDTLSNVHFYDQSYNNYGKLTGSVQYKWHFGDTCTSTQKSPVHKYDSIYQYARVRLNISDSGCNDSFTIGVPARWVPCEAIYIYYTADTGTKVNFVNYSAYVGFYTKFLWTFGDGATDTIVAPTHNYAHGGYYKVCQYLTDTTVGCSASICNDIMVGYGTAKNCRASFDAQTDTTLKVSFTNTSTSTYGRLKYYWYFGDGTIDTTTNPVHTYPMAGTYLVYLSINDSTANCYTAYFSTVTVGHSCVAKYNYVFDSLGFVHFNNLSFLTGTHTEYYWDFGDGSAYFGNKNPVHKYNSGTFMATLIITDTSVYCSSEYDTYIYQGSSCSAHFNAKTDTTLTAHFYDSTTIYSSISKRYLWNFGDSLTDSVRNPVHTYIYGGTYKVCEYVYDSGKNCSSTYCNTINVGDTNCHANFYYFADSTSKVRFTNASYTNRGALKYQWNFGDSTMDTATNPLHIYTRPDVYTVYLTVIDSLTGCSSTTWGYIASGKNGLGCRSYFQYDPDTNMIVHFYDSARTWWTPVKQRWAFGDSTGDTLPFPQHQYKRPGKYQVCLTIEDSFGLCSSTYCDSVTVAYYTHPCTAYFTNHADTSSQVLFTDLSKTSSTNIRYLWRFGDSDTSNLENPAHIYSKKDYYWVYESIYDSVSGCSSAYWGYVTVGEALRDTCSASFTPFTDSTLTAVFVTGKCKRSSQKYYWDFGDYIGSYHVGTTTHTYSKPGFYNVTLSVVDSVWGSSTTTKTIIVGSNRKFCDAKFYYKADTSLTVQFIDSSYSSYAGRDHFKLLYWSFDDGSISTDSMPTHTYKSKGIYNVCLLMTSDAGCSSFYCDTVNAGHYVKPCIAKFTVDSVDTLKKIIYITNHSIGADSTLWYFGDGDSTWGIKPTHTYGTTGAYNLCEKVYCSGGNSSTYCDTIKGAATRITRSGGGYTVKVTATGTATTEAAVSHSLTVFPNPVTNNLTLMLPDNVSEGVLHIKNIIGQELRTQKLNAKLNTLDMGTLPAGMYMLQLQTPQGLFVTKVMKQ